MNYSIQTKSILAAALATSMTVGCAGPETLETANGERATCEAEADEHEQSCTATCAGEETTRANQHDVACRGPLVDLAQAMAHLDSQIADSEAASNVELGRCLSRIAPASCSEEYIESFYTNLLTEQHGEAWGQIMAAGFHVNKSMIDECAAIQNQQRSNCYEVTIGQESPLVEQMTATEAHYSELLISCAEQHDQDRALNGACLASCPQAADELETSCIESCPFEDGTACIPSGVAVEAWVGCGEYSPDGWGEGKPGVRKACVCREDTRGAAGCEKYVSFTEDVMSTGAYVPGQLCGSSLNPGRQYAYVKQDGSFAVTCMEMSTILVDGLGNALPLPPGDARVPPMYPTETN